MYLSFWFSQTQKFGVTLLVKDFGPKKKSKFSFKKTVTMMKASVDAEHDDMLTNYTHPDDMAMNGEKPWRGGREKDPRLFTILLEATSIQGDLVLDCTASTGQCSFQMFYIPVVFKEFNKDTKTSSFHCPQVRASQLAGAPADTSWLWRGMKTFTMPSSNR
jgi:hypothetical protein